MLQASIVIAGVFLIFTGRFLVKAAPVEPIPTYNSSPSVNGSITANRAGDDEVIAAEGDEIVEEAVEEEYTVATRGLEKFSSAAATCLFRTIQYTHGQQIFRKDPCEFCLCLDGQIFCWWQECPPSSCTNPSECTSDGDPPLESPTSNATTTTLLLLTPIEPIRINQSRISSIDVAMMDITNNDVPMMKEMIRPNTSATTTSISAFCLIMGEQYEIGAKLPHNTGNCVECICDVGPRVTCSPHQCAPLEQDASDFHQPPADLF